MAARGGSLRGALPIVSPRGVDRTEESRRFGWRELAGNELIERFDRGACEAGAGDREQGERGQERKANGVPRHLHTYSAIQT